MLMKGHASIEERRERGKNGKKEKKEIIASFDRARLFDISERRRFRRLC